MPRPKKEFDRQAVLDSLTVPHENCNEPDSPFTEEQLDEMFPNEKSLTDYRNSTKRKRPPRAGGGTKTTREVFSKTRRCYVQIPVILTEDQLKAGKSSALSLRTEKQWSNYLSGFVSSNVESGAGGEAFIPKDDRPDGCKVFAVNNLVSSAVDGIEAAAKQEERFAKMKVVFDLFTGNRDKERQILNDDTAGKTDDEIREMLTIAAGNAGYTDEQTAEIMERLFASGE